MKYLILSILVSGLLVVSAEAQNTANSAAAQAKIDANKENQQPEKDFVKPHYNQQEGVAFLDCDHLVSGATCPSKQASPVSLLSNTNPVVNSGNSSPVEGSK